LWRDNLNALWIIFSDVATKKHFAMGEIRLLAPNCIVASFFARRVLFKIIEFKNRLTSGLIQ
jgi:hypothetical protein